MTKINAIIILMSLIITASVPCIVLADPITISLEPTDDSYVAAYDSEYHGGENVIFCDPSPTYGLLRFDLSSIPALVTITSATLKLHNHVHNAEDEGNPILIHRITSTWTETTVTWNNQPGHAALSSSSTTIGPGWRTADVTSDIQAFVSETHTNYGWKLIAGNTVGFKSKESDQSPLLDITYVPALPIPFTPLGSVAAIATGIIAFTIIRFHKRRT